MRAVSAAEAVVRLRLLCPRVVSSSRASVLAKRVDDAAKPCPHDRCDAGNIGAVALQQRSVTVIASFVKAAAVDLIRLDCADYETRRTDTRV